MAVNKVLTEEQLDNPLDIPRTLNIYFSLQEEIFKYFSYVEDWKVIPIEDQTECYWSYEQNNDGSGWVCYSAAPLTVTLITEGNMIYSGRIYTQRFLPRWVYPGKDYTMICVDTQTDDNKFLMIFDNKKQHTDPELIQAYKDNWGSL